MHQRRSALESSFEALSASGEFALNKRFLARDKGGVVHVVERRKGSSSDFSVRKLRATEFVVESDERGLITAVWGGNLISYDDEAELIGRDVAVLAAHPVRDHHAKHVRDVRPDFIKSRMPVNVRLADNRITACVKQLQRTADGFRATFLDVSELGCCFTLRDDGRQIAWMNVALALLMGFDGKLPVPASSLFCGAELLNARSADVQPLTVLRPNGQSFAAWVRFHGTRDGAPIVQLCRASAADAVKPRALLNVVTIESEIGSGISATVYRGALMRGDGGAVAVKSIDKRCSWLKGGNTVAIDNEVRLHGIASAHEAVVRLLDVVETAHHVHLVMELLHISARLHVTMLDRLRQCDAHRLLAPIARALVFLHEQHCIVHLDCKLENIVLDGEWSAGRVGVAKLCDFGLAVQKTPETWLQSTLTQGAGTVFFAAPEIFACYEMGGATFVGGPADVWSWGVCLFCALTGDNDADLVRIVEQKRLATFLRGKGGLPDASRALMERIFQADEMARPPMRDVLLAIE